jgi:hypothetical protein
MHGYHCKNVEPHGRSYFPYIVTFFSYGYDRLYMGELATLKFSVPFQHAMIHFALGQFLREYSKVKFG